MARTPSVSPQEFLTAAFPPDLRGPDESVLVSWPESFVSRETGKTVDFYRQRAWNLRSRSLFPNGAGWLYCVSTVARADKLRRRLVDVRQAFVLVCDDIGTKASELPVAPSYVLETSEGNYQWGYFIDPYDVSEPSGAAYYDACLVGLARAGFNDFGCRSASRVVKMPGATHRTGFVTRCVEWSPERSWALPELMAELQVRPALDVQRRGSGARVKGRHENLESVCDPVYQWLADSGMVLGHSDQWVHVPCPLAETHSNGDPEAGYSPLDYGVMGRGFHCFHSHDGAVVGLQHFLAWVISQGGPSTDPSYNRIRNILNVQH